MLGVMVDVLIMFCV